MTCDKCGGELGSAKAFRLSGCLVAVGFLLLGTSLIAVPLALVLGIFGTMGTGKATSARLERARVEAVDRLGKIPNLPPEILSDFKDDGLIDADSIGRLPHEQGQAVRQVVIDYGLAVGTGAAAGAVVGGVGTLVVVLLLVFGIPGTIIGLLLVRRRKLWRCAACGYATERL